MYRPLLLAATATLILLAGTTGAEHCTTWSTSQPEIDTVQFLGANGYYIDNDLCQPQCAFSVWFYLEANGIEGLQRGDEVVDDTCYGMIEADVIIS